MKIIWAYNPFEDNKTLRRLGRDLIRNLFDSRDQVKVTYVSSRAEPRLTNAFDIPKTHRFLAYPKKIIEAQLRSQKLKMNTVVLPIQSTSTTSSVKKLTDFAHTSKTDLIVIATHAKTGITRVILGSFAESLFKFSKTDLIFYTQNLRSTKKPQNIMLIHDYARKGMDGIERIIDYATKWNAAISILDVQTPEIVDSATRMKADIIAMTTKTFSPDIFRKIKVPVLVLKV